MRHRFRLALAVLAVTSVSCSSESSTPIDTPNASLAFSPAAITMRDSQPVAKLYLTTNPSGGRLSWQVSEKPTWLTLDPAGGTIDGIAEVTLTATVPANAQPGLMSAPLDLVSSGGVARVMVSITISASPRLQLSTATIAIPTGVDTQAIVLRNPGRGSTQWSAGSSAGWLTMLPSSGYVMTGDSAVVKLVANRTPLPAGSSSATITFSSNGTPAMIALPVTVSVAAAPRAVMRVSRLSFGGSGTRSFYLTNPGKGPLVWRASTTDAWLSATPVSGSVAPSDSVKVSVTANVAQAPALPATGSLTILSDAVDAPALPLAVTLVATSPSFGIAPLDYRVVDAEFSAAAGVLVTVSADPARLNVHDVETGEFWSLALPKTACCVAVRPDGRYAVVAHDAMLTYVDLTTRQLVRTYATTSDAIDVVLPMNGYAYVFPRSDQWVSIHGVNLVSGTESNGGTIFAGTRAKLHPDGEFMYGIWYLSPADLEKYDIRAGRPNVVSNSPYHGDYPMGYNLWMSQDGHRIFTEAGRVFRSSATASEDMRYAGRLEGIEGARAIGDSPSRGRIYALGAATFTYFSGVAAASRTADLQIYDANTLAKLGSVALPKIPSGSQSVDADGHYVFADATGSRIYVLMKAVPSSGLLKDWALVTLDASSLP